VNARSTFSDTFNHQILLGARYAFGTPPAPPPPVVPVAAPAPTPARTYLVFFDWDKSDLTSRAKQIIGEAAQASTRVQTTRIEVNGYTDLSGTAQYNQGLSVRRAKAVQAELIKDGVPAAEIGIHGYGESNPLVHTAKGVREPQNRRVEIILR
jgi:outer membrane protein OmpA-like peptidoglycan-associated protein